MTASAWIMVAVSPVAGFLAGHLTDRIWCRAERPARTGFRTGFWPSTSPAGEALALGAGLWAALAMADSYPWVHGALGWLLVLIALTDVRCWTIPDSLSLVLAAAGIAQAAFAGPAQLSAGLAGGLLAAGLSAAVALLYRRLRGRDGLGWGDVKLLGALGCWVSIQGVIPVIVLAALSGILFGGVRAALGAPVTRTTALPFGPFLCLAAWVVWLHGPGF